MNKRRAEFAALVTVMRMHKRAKIALAHARSSCISLQLDSEQRQLSVGSPCLYLWLWLLITSTAAVFGLLVSICIQDKATVQQLPAPPWK